MAYIKWKKVSPGRVHPYVYRSERVKDFKVVPGADGKREVQEKSRIKSVYLGSYRSYREKHPNGVCDTLIPTETMLKMLSEHQERIDMLRRIDDEVYQAFVKARS